MHCEKISVLFLHVSVHLFLCSSTIVLFNAGFCSFTTHLQFSSAHCYSIQLTALLSLRLALLWSSFPLQIVFLPYCPSSLLTSFPLQRTAVFDSLPFILFMFCTQILHLSIYFNSNLTWSRFTILIFCFYSRYATYKFLQKTLQFV